MNEFVVWYGLEVLFVSIIPSVVEKPRSVAQMLCDNCCIFGAVSSHENLGGPFFHADSALGLINWSLGVVLRCLVKHGACLA